MKRWESLGMRLFLNTSLLVMVGCGGGSSDNLTTSNLFPAQLTGGQEVPPVSTLATGTGSFVLNQNKTALTYDITVDGLSVGGMTSAHFHNAAVGLNSGSVRDLIGDFVLNNTGRGGTATGIWNNFDTPPLSNFLTELEAGRIYVNVHTQENPGGEIRAQVVLTPPGASGFTAIINGGQEVPPVSTLGTGTGVFVLNAAETELTFVITVTGLSGGGVTAAHFHNAPTGSNSAMFVRPLTADFSGNTATGIWRNTDSDPLTPTLVAALKARQIYVNIHTAANPGGEIRGQVIPNL